MAEVWRSIETGLRPAAQNIALDRALLEARAVDEISSTLRFFRGTPAALLGACQSAAQEFDTEFCESRAIPIQRRITNGDALYVDPAQIGWQLYLAHRDLDTSDMRVAAQRIGFAAACALSALGVDARVQTPSAIAVDGMVICSTGWVSEGEALMFEGRVLLDIDFESTRGIANPLERFESEAAVAPRQRITSLHRLTGKRPAGALVKRNLVAAFESEFCAEFQEGDVSLSEHVRYRTALAEIECADWPRLVQRPAADIHIGDATQTLRGGVLRARVSYDRVQQRIRRVAFATDIAQVPARMFADLEAALHETRIDRVEHAVRLFFAGHPLAKPFTAAAFSAVVRLALKLPLSAPTP